MTHNPLYEYWDAIGLPWRSSRAYLAEKFGIRKHAAYEWDVIEIATILPFAKGLLWPISVQVHSQFSGRMPALEFSGNIYFSDDARENLRRTVDWLVPIFGKGNETGSSNTIGCEWKAGPASVGLTVWPSDMRSFPTMNPSHAREPRLKSSCHIQINTGFRLSASAKERELFLSFTPIVRIPGLKGSSAEPHDRPAAQYELEFVRLPEQEFGRCYGWIGHSEDKSSFIFFERDLFIIPISDVVEFEVSRVLPAKGSGRSCLYVKCYCDEAGQKTKSVIICTASGADDLNDVSAIVANAIGKPLQLLPYDYDC